jgi:hypothetical protein
MAINLLDSLKKLVEWQRVVAAADKVPDLERRIALLESRIGSAPKFETCPSCGVGRWHKKKSEPSRVFGDLGGLDVTYGCNHCSYTEVKMET